ncbi:MAG: 50S ribosomal protein L25 [Candidatus Promineifilaceae bacterium]|jgi:large subunit ribosomal protein L25
MSDRVTIVAEPRAVTGKKVKQLRREGVVPGVIYGQSEPVKIQMDVKPLRRALRVAGTGQLVEINVDGKGYTVLAREIQQHVTRRDIIHVDFLEVDMASTIRSEAALFSVGESPLTDTGEGIIAQVLHSVEIECLPDALVSQIEFDISTIETTDDSITVADLVAPEGVDILTDPETLIARFEYSAIEEEEEEELEEMEAGDVEVIGREEEEELDEE